MALAINWGPALLMVFGLVITAVYQNHHFDKRIDDLRAYVDSQVKRLEDVIKSEVKRLEDRMGHIEDRITRVEERLEHPIYRP
ncbi:MAG TPA: hypothetical protein VMF91_05150 [Bryobacteraceae bacterium]|nr:hypothetical protein [Bryobacteraceae bacterium]